MAKGSTARVGIRRVTWLDFDGVLASAATHRICLMAGGSASSINVSDAFSHGQKALTVGAIKAAPSGLLQLLRLQGTAETIIVDLPDTLVTDVLEQGLGLDREEVELAPFDAQSDPDIERLMLALLAEAECGPAAPEQAALSGLSCAALGQALAVHFVRRSLSTKWMQKQPSRRHLGLRQIERVKYIVDTRLDEPLTLSDLASAAGASRAHFARGFRHTTGHTPMAYVQHRRIEKAKDLLTTTDRAILDVAMAVGFQSQSHFAVVFRRQTGVAPIHFRRFGV